MNAVTGRVGDVTVTTVIGAILVNGQLTRSAGRLVGATPGLLPRARP